MSWSSEQLSNANAIIRVGQSVGATSRDIVVALMAAMQESGLRNLNYGDRDSIGLFQQRNAWGSTQARLNPETAARMFFTGGNAGQRGLLDFKNRNSMSLSQAAQAVQVSAYPDAYAKWESQARQLAGNPNVGKAGDAGTTTTLAAVPGLDTLLKQANSPTAQAQPTPDAAQVLGAVNANDLGLGDQNPIATGLGEQTAQSPSSPLDAVTFDNSGPTQDPMSHLHASDLTKLLGNKAPGVAGSAGAVDASSAAAQGWRNAVVAYAHKMLGTPYVWGGTSPTGVDCSGLVQLAFKSAGISLPRVSMAQANLGHRVALNKLRPGDLVAWDNSSRNSGADHIAIYIGNGQIIEAPRPGRNVQVSGLYDTGQAWGVALNY